MRRVLFLLTLALYGFSAMDMHEWVRVPQVIAHLLEHHSDLGHHDTEDSQHDHVPFDADCHGEFCGCSGMIALVPATTSLLVSVKPLSTTLCVADQRVAPSAFSGNVWNPPKA